jgi:signal recognition particle GTPase
MPNQSRRTVSARMLNPLQQHSVYSSTQIIVQTTTLVAAMLSSCHAFTVLPNHCPSRAAFFANRRPEPRPSTTQLGVFDFFRQRTEEGFQQFNNLADATFKGELGRGLAEAAQYMASTNRAFANGRALSRQRLLQGIENLCTGVDPEALLEELEDVVLQANLGAQTTEDILREVDSFRRASGVALKREDLMSILRGKLVEALDVRQPRAILFSSSPELPTVVFVMGAVRCRK